LAFAEFAKGRPINVPQELIPDLVAALDRHYSSLKDATLRMRWVQISDVYWEIDKRCAAAGERTDTYPILVEDPELVESAVEEEAASSDEVEEIEKPKQEATSKQDAQKDKLTDDDDIEIVEGTVASTGRTRVKRRQGKVSYLPFDASKHTIWAKPVSSDFVRLILSFKAFP